MLLLQERSLQEICLLYGSFSRCASGELFQKNSFMACPSRLLRRLVRKADKRLREKIDEEFHEKTHEELHEEFHEEM